MLDQQDTGSISVLKNPPRKLVIYWAANVEARETHAELLLFPGLFSDWYCEYHQCSATLTSSTYVTSISPCARAQRGIMTMDIYKEAEAEEDEGAAGLYGNDSRTNGSKGSTDPDYCIDIIPTTQDLFRSEWIQVKGEKIFSF